MEEQKQVSSGYQAVDCQDKESFTALAINRVGEILTQEDFILDMECVTANSQARTPINA